ncbi:MAG: sulfite exporter TauE/SafE family protein [Pseudomonadota bacterium]
MIEAFLPSELGPLTATALLGVSFLGSFITAAFGIGGGVVVLAVFASLLAPAALIPVHGVVQLGSNAGRALIMREHISRAVFVPFVIGALIGVAIGGVVVVDLPPHIIQIAVGLFILWSIVARPPAFLRRAAWLAGGFSSFLTMFFGATGPFVAAYIKTQGFERTTHTGTHAACMTLQHGLKVFAFGLLGFAFGPYIPLIVGMIAFGFAGTVVGRKVLMKIDEKRFKLALNTMLVLLSLRLIWAGVSTYL